MNTNWNKINNELSRAILDGNHLGDLLTGLGCDVSVFPGQRRLRLPCPVHLGDHPNVEVVLDGRELPIHWRCYSHGCHEKFKSSLLGLVRGSLSCQQGRQVGMKEAIDFLNGYVGTGPRPTFKGQPPTSAEPNEPPFTLSRDRVRGTLAIPSDYFLERGFSPEVLDAFDVGESRRLKRAVVPLYDESGEVCIGYAARSKFRECDRCKRHHFGPDCRYGQRRWRMPSRFPKRSYLFNYSAAKTTDAPFVFLVEGAPDVLRLAEAGYVGVALLGSEVSDEQLRKLRTLEKDIWVAFDPDEAGEEARKRLFRKVENQGIASRFVFLSGLGPKDIGDTSVDELRRDIRSYLEGEVKVAEHLAGPADGHVWHWYAEKLERSRRRLHYHEEWLKRSEALTRASSSSGGRSGTSDRSSPRIRR